MLSSDLVLLNYMVRLSSSWLIVSNIVATHFMMCEL